ncbi:CheR family methyltransferase [Pedobacter sp. MC2016-24]|uniref:CheR family methyltransferase n=1 Tax=Pedobacter sp. MC2016-24 TaxID=2780090 RepID=UPI00187E810F|nr:CheR family methyltransferase [Pedobacter sp. MC2016-24]MBE9599053.1 PAS domain-containing protein [Pedobacter sp. MC2016-24]
MNKIKGTEDERVSPAQFPIVGIGASAGGLKAIKQFLQALPEHSGMAYVFVQHLSPTNESSLPEILKKISKIPVHLITDNIHLEPDNLYIIPVNKIVTATDGVLKLVPLDEKHHRVKIIDLFFSSLAVVHQSYAIGIILSGTLTDGTLGLDTIKAYGGITFAQDTSSAEYDGMPSSAISSGSVDFILPPDQIAEHLMTINHPFNAKKIESSKSVVASQQDEEIFKQLLTILRVRRGVDFTYYKPSTLKRRIVRRMALNDQQSPADYLGYLRENKSEQDALYNDMLISVTHFFRDPASFEMLYDNILPALMQQKDGNEPLRIWIAGCATGEEAYSMAICLQEQLGDKTAAMKIQIFATDISETAIAKARTGLYRPTDLEGLSISRLDQFFTRIDGSFQVNKAIRDMCVFAHHNLLKDPPFSRVDLISCRNVLIYLEPVLQKRALTTFHYSLTEQGFLMLGKSESIGKNTDLFAAYNNSTKIFRRNGTRGRFMQVTSVGSEQNFKTLDQPIPKKTGKADIYKIADELILSNYTPAGVLVDEQFDIIQFRGVTDQWLSLSPGKASLNLLKMARIGLTFELRNLLHQVKKTNGPAKKEGIVFTINEKQDYVDIEVSPLNDAGDTHYLVLFKKGMIPGLEKIFTASGDHKLPDPRDLRISQLENELLQSRTDMTAITEEQEAINEELISVNQELLSGSEELQSLNEELETSKEELQSTNEEITIINNELVDRNEQLNNARIYTEAIINTIRDPLIILDKDLKVKRATDGFYAKFKVSAKETEGKLFYELGNHQWDIPALRVLLEGILPEKKSLADYEVTHVFPNIGRRVMWLNTRQLDDLILLSIEDITDKRKVEEGLAAVEMLFQESKERLKLAIESTGLGTWDYNPLTGELIWDNRCKQLFGVLPEQQINYTQFIDMLHPDDAQKVDVDLKRALKRINGGEYDQEFRTAATADNKLKWIRFKGKAYFNKQGIANRFVGTSLDITRQKLLDEATVELMRQKDDFISIASHELKTPITSLKASLQLIHRMKDNPSPALLSNMIELSNRSLDKVSILVEDLLNASRINHGQLHLNKGNFKIAEMVENCCSHVRLAGAYTIETTGDLELEINADKDRIEQVIVNFVNNAIKYAPESTKIIVYIEKLKEFARISVSDIGPGIPAEKIPHLFDRYYRADERGLQYSGLGLGLYICAEIIKKHEGQIGAESKEGKGSTFWFTLPLDH